MTRGYGPWLVDFDDQGRPIIAPAPPELRPTWEDVAQPYPSPYGAGGEQQIGGSAVCPAGATTPIFKWAGPGGRPYNIRLCVAPAQNPQNLVPAAGAAAGAPIVLGNMFDEDIHAIIRWQVGSLQYEAELDLVAGSLALPLMATRLEVLIVNGSLNLCGFGASVAPTGAEQMGQFCEARRTRKTDLAATPAVTLVQIPPFARAYWMGVINAAQFTMTSRDTKGAVSNIGLQQGNSGSPRYYGEIPNGASVLGITTNSAGVISASIIFQLGLP